MSPGPAAGDAGLSPAGRSPSCRELDAGRKPTVAAMAASSSSESDLDSDAELEFEEALKAEAPPPIPARQIVREMRRQVGAPPAGEHTTQAAVADASSARKARLDAIAAEKRAAAAAKLGGGAGRGGRLRVGQRAGRRAPSLPPASGPALTPRDAEPRTDSDPVLEPEPEPEPEVEAEVEAEAEAEAEPGSEPAGEPEAPLLPQMSRAEALAQVAAKRAEINALKGEMGKMQEDLRESETAAPRYAMLEPHRSPTHSDCVLVVLLSLVLLCARWLCDARLTDTIAALAECVRTPCSVQHAATGDENDGCEPHARADGSTAAAGAAAAAADPGRA